MRVGNVFSPMTRDQVGVNQLVTVFHFIRRTDTEKHIDIVTRTVPDRLMHILGDGLTGNRDPKVQIVVGDVQVIMQLFFDRR